MASSIIVPVRRAVINGLRAAIADKSVSCTYGYEGYKDDQRREQIYTNRARAAHEPASLRADRNFRDERMDFDVVFLVLGISKTSEETDAAALALGLVFEEFIADRKNNELEVPGLQWIRVADMELNNAFNSNGTISELTYTLRYQARLT